MSGWVKTFEVAVYNKDVRDLVKKGEKHQFYEDKWGDIHFIEIKAMDKDEARVKAQRKHPPEKGFVIGNIVQTSVDP
ncbi:MAG: hypothetical protein FJX46_17120 [Alphaproteobacteria bacterium]|nr:hypothetical protein [Alphaproteobacteria bacterium]